MRKLRAQIGLAGLITATPLLASMAAAQPSAQIGYVDVPRILVQSSPGAAARERLEREKAALQREIDQKRAELEKLGQELSGGAPGADREGRREKREVLERKTRDLKRMVDDARRELARKERALLQRVLQQLTGVIERYAKAHGYRMIIEKRAAGVVYGSAEADLTDEILAAYNQEVGRLKKESAGEARTR